MTIAINRKIKECANTISERLAETPIFDFEKSKLIISAHIKSTLYDCLKIQLDDLDRDLTQKKIVYNTCQGSNTAEIAAEIIAIKNEIRQRNMLRSGIEQNAKLGLLIRFLKEKSPELLSEFYEGIDNKITNEIQL